MDAPTPKHILSTASSRERRRFEQVQNQIQRITSGELDVRECVMLVRDMIQSGELPNLEPMLPMMFSLKGEPYNLNDHFPFSPLFSLHRPKRLTVKSGRQCTKCGNLSLQHVVRLDDGRQVALADVRVGDRVQTLDDNLRIVSGRVARVFRTGKRRSVRLTTRMGSEIEVSREHQIRVFSGYAEASTLRPGDRIAAVRRGGVFAGERQARDRIVLTAYLIGDGSIGCSGNFCVTNWNSSILEECEFLSGSAGVPTRRGLDESRPVVHFSRAGTLREWVTADGLWGKSAAEKFLPAWVFRLSRTDTILFLNRLWSTDGSVLTIRPTRSSTSVGISYATISRRLARDVRSLLNKLGMPSTIRRGRAMCNGKDCGDAYVVRVETREGWQRFFELFPDIPGKPPVPIPTSPESHNRDTIPREVGSTIRSLCRSSHDRSLNAAGLRRSPKYAMTRGKFRDYLDHLAQWNPEPAVRPLRNLLEGDVIWDTVIKVEHIGLHETGDLEISRTSNYVMDGVVTHNSTSVSSSGVCQAATIPFFTKLYISPRYEQTRRLSDNSVAPFIDESPVKSLLVGPKTKQNVLQREFLNKSKLIFSFAMLDADRTRGISSEANAYDECQDLDFEHVKIIQETMSHAKWGWSEFTGTPKTLDNGLEKMWLNSSQAEWMIPCTHCTTNGKPTLNIPSREFHLLDMIGPVRNDISEKRPAIICHNCRQPIFARMGRWVHRYNDRRWEHAGYHVPQMILPLHFADPEKWAEHQAKVDGGEISPATVFNEVFGESYDLGTKLVSESDLRNAALLPWDNNPRNPSDEVFKALKQNRYIMTVLAVDWGGGGEDEVSFTCVALLGMHNSGHIDCLWGRRLMTPNEHSREANQVMDYYRMFQPDVVAHDYTGAGALREWVLQEEGVPVERIIPIAYVRAASSNIMNYIEATVQHPRAHYRADKSRSLQLTTECLKRKILKTFKFDHKGEGSPGLLYDFLSLVEDKKHGHTAGDIYSIQRGKGSDDFAQAVNIGCLSMWYSQKSWPRFGKIASRYNLTQAQEQSVTLPFLQQP